MGARFANLRQELNEMKKTILLGLMLMAAITMNAQTSCFANPLYVIAGLPGLWPNPQTGPLPDGNVGQAYSETITVIVPADTTIDVSQFGLPLGVITVSINNLDLTGVSGLPAGMTYSCDNAGCTWPNNDYGCFKFSGTPTVGGVYQVVCSTSLNINLPTLGAFQTPPQAVTYDLTILGTTSVDPNLTKGFALSAPHPNPASRSTRIDFTAPESGMVSFRLIDLQGKVLSVEEKFAPAGDNQHQIDLSSVSSGIYLVEFRAGDIRLSTRLVVE